jgi:hypothetical protein
MVVADSAVITGAGAGPAAGAGALVDCASRPGERLTSPMAAKPNVHLLSFISYFLSFVVMVDLFSWFYLLLLSLWFALTLIPSDQIGFSPSSKRHGFGR